MASDTLSPDSAVLFGGGDAAAAGAPSRPTDARPYDFQRPNLISKDRMRRLEAMYGLLAKSVEGWLTGRIRGDQIELNLTGVEHFSFGEFVRSLPTPSCSFVYDIQNTGGQAIVEFGREFSFFLVERLLGGVGEPIVPERALTLLERMIVRLAADHVAAQLGEVWRDHVPLELSLDRFEPQPDMLQIANRDDPVLVGNVEVAFGAMRSPIVLCIPFSVLEKFFSGNSAKRAQPVHGSDRERAVDQRNIQASLRAARLPLAARFPTVTVPIETLSALAPGSVLPTTLSSTTPVTVLVNGQPRFRGVVGNAGGSHYGVQILEATSADADRGPTIPPARVSSMSTAESALAFGAGAPNGLDAPDAANSAGNVPLAALFGLSLPIAIELGRTSMSIQDILALGRGSVIQLERLVGDPVDVFVGDRRFAEAEVVVLGEQFGVRITRILSSPMAVEESK